MGQSPTKNHKDDKDSEESHLEGKAEKTEALQFGEGKVQDQFYSSVISLELIVTYIKSSVLGGDYM